MNFYQYLNLDNLGKIKLYEEIFFFFKVKELRTIGLHKRNYQYNYKICLILNFVFKIQIYV